MLGFASDVVIVARIRTRNGDEYSPRKRRSFCCIMKKRPANFRGGSAGSLIASQIILVDVREGWRRRFFDANSPRLSDSISADLFEIAPPLFARLEDGIERYHANFHG